MEMREDLILELEAEYAERRADNERQEMARKEIIHTKYPEVDCLVTERENLIHGAIRGILNRQERPDNIPSRMEELNLKIRQALAEAGLPEDYLAPVHHCPICADTGYVGYPVKEPCECFSKAYQQKIRERIGLGGGIHETFDSFNSSIIPDEPVLNTAYTQRQMTEAARNKCEKWANDYPDVPFRNVLLTGKSGLGKTFLMHAMANRMIERGLNVLTISAYQFVQSARESYFEREDSLDELLDVPVLMMDDLGSEPLIRNVTVEQLFNLINERIIRGKATVISTNLKLEELRERYTEGIVSRISDPASSLVITLEGRDLRRVGG